MDGESSLSTLYAQWMLLQAWKDEIRRYGEKAVYEIVAIRERHSVTALCYRGSNWLSADDFSKLRGEVTSCRKIEPKHHGSIVDGIIKNLADMRDAKAVDQPSKKGSYFYGQFKPRLSRDTMDYLASFDLMTAISLLLRYECLCPQGQQWAVPKEWIGRITAAYGLDVVAFSSPLNKQVALSPDSQIQYYSGFAEDAAFGSLGSFFNVKPEFLDKFSGRRCSIEANPPFIEQILLDAAVMFDGFFQYASQMKEPPELTIMFVTPDWSDAEFFERTKRIGAKCIRSIQLHPGEHAYENTTVGNTIVARQRSWLFILSNRDIMELPLAGFKTVGELTQIAKYGGRGIRRN